MKKKLKCFVCHKEVNEEDDYVFKGQTVHKGECLKSMIDEYNAVRNLQIRNKRLCAEIERLNNIIDELECWLRKNLPIEEKNDLQICLNKLEQLKNKKIYGSSKYEVVYFGEALGSDKE